MKKTFFKALAATAVVGTVIALSGVAASAAEYVLNADNLTPEDITETRKVGDGDFFTLVASADHKFTVDVGTSGKLCPQSGLTITNRLKTNGKSSTDGRLIQITLTKTSDVLIEGITGKSSEVREFGYAEGTEFDPATATVLLSSTGSDVSSKTITLAPGTYSFGAITNGFTIYYMKVTEKDGEVSSETSSESTSESSSESSSETSSEETTDPNGGTPGDEDLTPVEPDQGPFALNSETLKEFASLDPISGTYQNMKFTDIRKVESGEIRLDNKSSIKFKVSKNCKLIVTLDATNQDHGLLLTGGGLNKSFTGTSVCPPVDLVAGEVYTLAGDNGNTTRLDSLEFTTSDVLSGLVTQINGETAIYYNGDTAYLVVGVKTADLPNYNSISIKAGSLTDPAASGEVYESVTDGDITITPDQFGADYLYATKITGVTDSTKLKVERVLE